MHNVLFVSLLIIGCFFFVARPLVSLFKERFKFIDIFLAGFFIALGLFVRTSEFVWVALFIFLGFWWFRSKDLWKTIFIFLIGFCFGLIPFFSFNQILYQNPLRFGYIQQSVDPISANLSSVFIQESLPSVVKSSFDNIKSFLFPEGLHWRTLGKNMIWYGFMLFWWISIFVVLGLIIFWKFIKKEDLKKQSALWFYLVGFILTGIWLSLFYGNAFIYDNPDPTQITIANSYIRYWLPIFVMTTPFAALTITWVLSLIQHRLSKNIISFLIFLLFFISSFSLVFFHPQDGIIPMHLKLSKYELIRAEILSSTEPESVIITDRSDKIFFPHRRIRYPLRDENTYAIMPKIIEYVPLYYFGITFPSTDFEYLNQVKLKSMDLQIEHLKTFGEESFYQIKKRSTD